MFEPLSPLVLDLLKRSQFIHEFAQFAKFDKWLEWDGLSLLHNDENLVAVVILNFREAILLVYLIMSLGMKGAC